jgi:hypothetical protein
MPNAVAISDQNIGTAVGQDVANFLGLQMPVYWHHRAAQRRRAARNLEEREVVAQHHGHGRTPAQAERPKSCRRPRDTGVNFVIADGAFAADDQFNVPGSAGLNPGGRPEYRRSQPSSCR